MPALDVKVSAKLKENQKDALPVSELDFVDQFTDIGGYEGVRRVVIPAGETVTVGVTNIDKLRHLFVKVLSGSASGVRLDVKKSQSESTAFAFYTYFCADVKGADTVRFTAFDQDVILLVLTAGL